jgi:hypothetical protein
MTYKVKQLSASTNFLIFDKKLDDLAKEGWVVKFSNISVVQEDPAIYGKEPSVAFHALLEREKET